MTQQPQAMPSTGHDPDLRTQFQRFQRVEEIVIQCVDIAGGVAESLSFIDGLDRSAIAERCTAFNNNIQDALQLVDTSLGQRAQDRNFEGNCYHALVRSHLVHEKVNTVHLHLQAMQELLVEAGAWVDARGSAESGAAHSSWSSIQQDVGHGSGGGGTAVQAQQATRSTQAGLSEAAASRPATNDPPAVAGESIPAAVPASAQPLIQNLAQPMDVT